jgi:hypothetical protein
VVTFTSTEKHVVIFFEGFNIGVLAQCQRIVMISQWTDQTLFTQKKIIPNELHIECYFSFKSQQVTKMMSTSKFCSTSSKMNFSNIISIGTKHLRQVNNKILFCLWKKKKRGKTNGVCCLSEWTPLLQLAIMSERDE